MEVPVKCWIVALALGCNALAQTRSIQYENLVAGQAVNGFRTVSVYLNDSGSAMGARFRHARSGFTVDLLSIQSVPQAFIWITTYPTSNMGEPHTQEHLLLGKGNKGRNLGSEEVFSLVTSSAFTSQWMTCYHFYTSAGPEAFHQEFENTMDALLQPDYTDEEVRREVRNFGVEVNPADGLLRLEEKGTVYNEMVTSMNSSYRRLLEAATRTIYGPEHPLAFNSGGLPAALRIIRPEDIRRFHTQHYFLANMGVIASLPKEMTLAETLARLDATLKKLEPKRPNYKVMTEEQLPQPRPAPAGSIQYADYPFRNDQQAGGVMVFWPANRTLSHWNRDLFELFLNNFAGDPDTNLYRRLIDSQTREWDLGAAGVLALAPPEAGNPTYVLFRSVPVARMNDQDLGRLRDYVTNELVRIASYGDGSPELAAFNERLKGRTLQQRRDLSKFVNSPPKFGFRGTGDDWALHLYELNKSPGFRKMLTNRIELDEIEKVAGESRNIWRDYLPEWKLTGVTPWVVAAKPNPDLIRQEETDRAARVAAEVARLKEKYGLAGDQEAIRRYRSEYDAGTRVLDAAARSLPAGRRVDHPPQSLDDQLQYATRKLPGGVALVTSTFDNLTSGTTGIALRLDGIPEDQLVYVSALPNLLKGAGVIEGGKVVPYDEMAKRLRKEILRLETEFRINPRTARYELVIRGSGNNLAEAKRALDWIELVLFHPDWRVENLPRLRDVVDQELAIVRTTTQRPEETWVDDPARAYLHQDSALLLATSSFMTREHSLLRLRWRLKGGGSPEVFAFVNRLAEATGDRARRKARLAEIERGTGPETASLSPQSKVLAADLARDLDNLLSEIPDSSLAADWAAVCHQIERDLETEPEKTLAALDGVRRALLTRNGARMFLVSSRSTQEALTAGIETLSKELSYVPFRKADYISRRRIDERLQARDPEAVNPVYVGLLNGNTQGGVFLNSARAAAYGDADPEAILDFVASNLYAGHGAHTLFMKTWAAGLAYSNGIRMRPLQGRINYYAERTQELPQTLRFVTEEIRKARPDPELTEYAIANSFDGTRPAESYEVRGEVMAEDLTDGLMPDQVNRFYKSILTLRQRPDLTSELFRRLPRVYGQVLPGLSGNAGAVPDGVNFVIGPEKQLVAYEEYLKNVVSRDTRLFRLYPRDFWAD